MRKWGYLYAFIGTYNTINSISPIRDFNKFGADGWELVSIYEQYAFFKREVIEAKQEISKENKDRYKDVYVDRPPF